MGFLRRFFSRDAAGERAAALYAEILRAARNPALYLECGAPDTIDGRFEAIMLYAHLLFRRLMRANGDAALGQAVFDHMFVDFERSLREMGVGDQGVPPRIKHMGKSAYGRFAAYDAGLAGGAAAQEEALARNFYGTLAEPPPGALARLAGHQRAADQALAAAAVADILARRPLFPGIGA